MSTRRADPDAPLCQWRYMSSPEFLELQAISGTAVAKRCALLVSGGKRELLWFIQGLSLPENGGLKKLAAELVAMFPERIIPRERWEMGTDYRNGDTLSREECAQYALGKWPDQRKRTPYGAGGKSEPTLEEFLVDLCINPTIRIKHGGIDSSEFDEELTRKRFLDLNERDFKDAGLRYFKDIVGALIEYKRRYEEKARKEFCQTAITRQIWKQLDELHALRVMGLIDGLEGRGKTEAARAWCKCHLGVARFMSMKGTATKTAHFREMARALGVGYGNTRKASEMQAGVEEVLRISGLMPVIDEAHYFFNQSLRIFSRPEMLDWIDTALCNPASPVALVTTPQFMICMERAAGQTGWNYRQFKRRCKRYVMLPDKNTAADIETVARHLVPGADKFTVKAIVAYEAMSGRDLSAVGDAAREAKLLAEQDGAKRVAFEHVKRAIYEVLMPSDVPWAEMEKKIERAPRAQRRGRAAMPAKEPTPAPEPSETPEPEATPRFRQGGDGRNRVRLAETHESLAVV